MNKGMRIIDGRAFVLSGLESKDEAKATAKILRSRGHRVRLIRRDILNWEIWVL